MRKRKRPLADISERSRDVTSQIIFVNISIMTVQGAVGPEPELLVVFISNTAKHDQRLKPPHSMHSTSCEIIESAHDSCHSKLTTLWKGEKQNVRSKVQRNKWKAYSDKTFWSSGLLWWNSTSSIRLSMYLLKKNTKNTFVFYLSRDRKNTLSYPNHHS